MSHFNAFQAFDSLKNSGLNEPQARAVIETIEQAALINSNEVATKTDLAHLETKLTGQINELKVSVNWLQRLFFGSVLLILINIGVTLIHP